MPLGWLNHDEEINKLLVHENPMIMLGGQSKNVHSLNIIMT